MLADAVERTGLGTRVIRITKNLWHPEVIRAVAQCDIVFGCMDTVDGRYLLNALASYYSIPYFDIGVRLDAAAKARRKGRIREVCGTVNYFAPWPLQPNEPRTVHDERRRRGRIAPQ